MKRPRLTAGQTDFERPFGDNEQLGGKVDLRADIGTRGERIAYDVRFAAAYRFRYSAAGNRRVFLRKGEHTAGGILHGGLLSLILYSISQCSASFHLFQRLRRNPGKRLKSDLFGGKIKPLQESMGGIA